jgi:predicted Zn-dependent peptidase
MHTETSSTDTTRPTGAVRSRAVFSTEDFTLIRTAIAHYLQEIQDQPESIKYANLYHRVGRVAPTIPDRT